MPVKDTQALWDLCAQRLRAQLPGAVWRSTFEDVEPAWSDGDELVLTVPNAVVRARIESRYLSLLTNWLAEVNGAKLLVRLEVRSGARDEDGLGSGDLVADPEWEAPAPALAAPPAPPPTVTPTPASARVAPLNPGFTFDAFVIGDSNRFAHAAARAVAETPGTSAYNPLFIHGHSGLGKTHLLHAIGNYVRENFRDHQVVYVSTETFLNEFIDAIRTRTTLAFQRRYRQCDVLLVDDIQFMENKEKSKEEFFHTFNDLYGASRQIVITSDRAPSSFVTFENRLRSRFLMGVTTDVQPPELETRLAILRAKADALGAHVPDDVMELIATHVKDNIRELEGALHRVTAHARLTPEQPLTRELAETILSDLLARSQPSPITPAVILAATTDLFGFTAEELCGPSRRRPLVTARQVSMYVFRELTDFSYPAIAREFGGRDHTTVIHAVEKIAALMKERRQIYDQVTELVRRIRGGG
jgi:chromosomal replication initiator protein